MELKGRVNYGAMLKIINEAKRVSRKDLADKNLGVPYHDRLNKEIEAKAYTPFFSTDCGNGYMRFEYFKNNM